MATLVSTGQLTITDQNDARSITALMGADKASQQVATTSASNEAQTTYLPDLFASQVTLTPSISIGGLTAAEAWAALSSKRFSYAVGPGGDLTSATTSTSFCNSTGADITTPFIVTHAANGSGTASTFAIKGNLKTTVASFVVYFQATYTDATTGLQTDLFCDWSLSSVKTGTDAVAIILRGSSVIEEAVGSNPKNYAAMAADLVRGGVIDTSVTYQWFDTNGGSQILSTSPSAAQKYGMKTTTGTVPIGTFADLGTANMPSVAGSGTAYNTLVISEVAVVDMAFFKVIATGTDNKSYSQFFPIWDVSDPYAIEPQSTAGNVFKNGTGTSLISPKVSYGATELTSDAISGMTFVWYIYDKNGKRGAFVNKANITENGGRVISASGSGSSAMFTYGGTDVSAQFAIGDIIKCVKPDGNAFFYEVGAKGTNTVTIRTPSTNTWLSFVDFPAPSAAGDFNQGKLYQCVSGGTRSTTGSANFTLHGDDIDSKGRLVVEGSKP